MTEYDNQQTAAGKVRGSSDTGSSAAAYTTNPNSKYRNRISNENIKVLLGKIVLYLRKMPKSSRMRTPARLVFNDIAVGFLIDKTGNKTQIHIKDNLRDVADWDLRIPHQTIVNITLDDEGKMLKGDICSNQGLGLSDYISFDRDKLQNRHLYYDGKAYIPYLSGWAPVKNILMREIIDEFCPNNLLSVLLNCNFGNVMLSLANMRLCLR